MKKVLAKVSTVLLVGYALFLAAFVVHKQFFKVEDASALVAERSVADWDEMLVKKPAAGTVDAPVKVVVFFDYQCPFCYRLEAPLDALVDRYPEEVAVAYRHLPLARHEHAYEAARAAECAGEQGRFKRYHDVLFEHRQHLGAVRWDSLAQSVAVPDLPAFRTCLERSTSADRIVKDDVRLAETLGIRATPTMVINGKIVPGALSLEQLDRLVQQALREKTLL